MRYCHFSENGYYVASAAAGNEIKIWDLRKLKEIKSIVMREDDYVVNALKFETERISKLIFV